MPGRTQQMRQQRGGRALALGAGNADRVRQPAIGIGVLAEPQRGTADELCALRQCVLRLGLVRADARRFDHHVERSQQLATELGFNA